MAQWVLNALPEGYELDRYRIEGVLGAGGFAITYLGRHIALGQKVAIKEYLPDACGMRAENRVTVRPIRGSEDEFTWGLERFAGEARTLAGFRHPSIVPVTDIFEANGTAYMVMDYVDGEPFDDVLKRKKVLSEPELRTLLTPLLDALEVVHNHGVLHRDIKPSNIFIRQDGTPVLLDFGAARQALGAKSQSLTAVFTPRYAPNEQYSSRGKQGPWTDIYALGATLYKAITGELPPEAPDRAISDPFKPVSQLAGRPFDRTLLAAIDKALAFNSEDRPQKVSEFRKLLGADAPDGETVTPLGNGELKTKGGYEAAGEVVELNALPSSKTRRKRKWPGIAFAALLLAVLVGGGYRGWTIYQERQLQQTEEARRKVQAEEEARRRVEAARRIAAEADRKRRAEEEARRKAEAEQKQRAEEAKKRKQAARNPSTPTKDAEQMPKPASKHVAWYSRAAELGNTKAQIVLAGLYLRGEGVTRDLAKAAQLYRQAAVDGNDPGGQYALGMMLERGDGMKRDDIEALLWYRRAASAGHPLAMYRAGLLHIKSKKVPLDFARARGYFETAARRGVAAADYQLGVIHEKGRGTAKSKALAFDHYARASAEKYQPAIAALARLTPKLSDEDIIRSTALPKPEAKHHAWYARAAKLGKTKAQLALAKLYLRGQGVDRDLAKAYALFRDAARGRDPDAQYALAVMLERGMGTPKNQKEALAWYRRAAKAGHVSALLNLGFAYVRGVGVRQDYEKAREYFEVAAAKNFAEAQYNLGLIYEHGLGVDKDKPRAFMWFSLAATGKNIPARRALDRLTVKMTAAEVANGARLIAAFKASRRVKRK